MWEDLPLWLKNGGTELKSDMWSFHNDVPYPHFLLVTSICENLRLPLWKWERNQIIHTCPEILHSVLWGLIPRDLEFGWAVLHGTDSCLRSETYWLLALLHNHGSEEFQGCAPTFFVDNSETPLEGSAAEAAYLAGGCLWDQRNIKIPSWVSILDSLVPRCSLHTAVVSDLSRCILQGPYIGGSQSFPLASPDAPLWESLAVAHLFTLNAFAVVCILCL